MSKKDDLALALNAARSAKNSAKKSAARSPNSFIKFLRDLGLRTLAETLSEWIKDNWSTIVDFIKNALGLIPI